MISVRTNQMLPFLRTWKNPDLDVANMQTLQICSLIRDGGGGQDLFTHSAKKGPLPLPLKVRRHERWLCERDQAGRWIPWQRGEQISFPYLPIFVSPHLSKYLPYLPIFLFHIFPFKFSMSSHFYFPYLPKYLFHIFPNIFSISSQISFQYLPIFLFHIFPGCFFNRKYLNYLFIFYSPKEPIKKLKSLCNNII